MREGGRPREASDRGSGGGEKVTSLIMPGPNARIIRCRKSVCAMPAEQSSKVADRTLDAAGRVYHVHGVKSDARLSGTFDLFVANARQLKVFHEIPTGEMSG